MAKPAVVALDPDEPFAEAGARVVRRRAEELFEHAEGVLDTDDIERVHDMRVATRRLRAVLEIFRPVFGKVELRAALRDVKQLADALGERRDPDVHIAAMEAFAAVVEADQRPGVEALLVRLRERQVAGNAVLAEALDHASRSGLRDRLLALADAAERQ
jgi:CHAD domain-containing protein